MINFKDLKTPYLIAEIGINHNGDIQIAKKLIDAAFSCQWDCVKLQKRVPEISVPQHQKKVIRKTPWGDMTYLEYRKKLELSKKDYDYIDKYCKEKPLSWAASVWDIPSLEFILRYDIPFIKIPSAKLTDMELLKEAAKSKKPLIVSTGMSTIREVDKAVSILERDARQFVLMHCHSAYPAPPHELNISCIKLLKDRYGCPVGYSGHEYGFEGTVFAVALGAMIIERHITLDHTMWGTDQISSVEVMGMDILRKRIRDVLPILGNGKKRVAESEKEIRKKLRGV